MAMPPHSFPLPQEQYVCLPLQTWTLYNHLMQEQHRLLSENSSLSATLHDLQAQLAEGRTACEALTRRSERKMRRRRYRQRRDWLEKKYACAFTACACKYSSKIALNCHMRKKHPQNH